MSKTFVFYAMKGSEVAGRLRSEVNDLVRQVGEQVKEAGYYSANEIDNPAEDELTVESVTDAARQICTGNLPTTCNHIYFDALGRLAGLVGEDLPLYEFEDTRWSYMDAVGILTLFQKTAPFPLPVPEPDGDNGTGFLQAGEVATLVANKLAGLPKTKDAAVLSGREQFLEVLESVAEGGLDVLVVY